MSWSSAIQSCSGTLLRRSEDRSRVRSDLSLRAKRKCLRRRPFQRSLCQKRLRQRRNQKSRALKSHQRRSPRRSLNLSQNQRSMSESRRLSQLEETQDDLSQRPSQSIPNRKSPNNLADNSETGLPRVTSLLLRKPSRYQNQPRRLSQPLSGRPEAVNPSLRSRARLTQKKTSHLRVTL